MLARPFGLGRWDRDFGDGRGGAWHKLKNEKQTHPRKKGQERQKWGNRKWKRSDEKEEEKEETGVRSEEE